MAYVDDLKKRKKGCQDHPDGIFWIPASTCCMNKKALIKQTCSAIYLVVLWPRFWSSLSFSSTLCICKDVQTQLSLRVVPMISLVHVL